MKNTYSFLFWLLIAATFFGGGALKKQNKNSLEPHSGTKTNSALNVSIKVSGLCYGPHRDNENPDYNIQPTVSELAEDIAFIKNLTTSIRSYGVTDNLEQIPILCQQYGIDCYPAAWISTYGCENERQINQLIQIANQNLSHVKGLIIGSEVLLRNDISEERLIEYISRVKQATTLPVASSDIWKVWLDHPQLAQAVDILFVHIYPYWDGIAVEGGVAYILEKWNELKTRFPGKIMILGETGWPSQGEQRGNAIPNEANQKKYLSDFISMVDSSKIESFYFSVFDEKWKTKEGKMGSHWGIYNSDGSIKPLLKDLIPTEAQNGISRIPRQVVPIEKSFPLYIYCDGCDSKNSFYSSGWMGELATMMQNDSMRKDPSGIIDESCAETPFSGNSCIRLSYTPSPGQWGGIYWQFPVNNWGVYPGYDLSKSINKNDTIKLKFHVRGKNGGEKAEFKTGGIKDYTLSNRDSYGPISTGVITLKKEWEEYSINLTGQNLSMVIGGFVWVTNYSQNPLGTTFYLDDIAFEIVHGTESVQKENSLPTDFFFTNNYPNPFNSSTMIGYQLKKSAEIDISIYDIEGQNIVTLINQNQQAGIHHVVWNSCDRNRLPVSSGVYICKLMVNKTVIDSKKMMLLK
jgi:exo-beta-1,3-glucanase (GH17 family)